MGEFDDTFYTQNSINDLISIQCLNDGNNNTNYPVADIQEETDNAYNTLYVGQPTIHLNVLNGNGQNGDHLFVLNQPNPMIDILTIQDDNNLLFHHEQSSQNTSSFDDNCS